MTKNNKEGVFGRNEKHEHKLEKNRGKKEYSSHIPIFLGVGLVAVACFVLLTGTAWASNSTTTENGQILVNGEPFFPIGTSVALWGEPKTDEKIDAVFAEMKAAGFNTVRDQNSISSTGYMSYTDKVYRWAENNDLKVMLILRNGPNRPAIYNEAIGTYKTSPAAFAWEVWDEPTVAEVPTCKWAYAKIQSLDTTHICYATFMHGGSAYLPDGTETWLDYALGDGYPIMEKYDPDDKYIQSVVTKFLRILNSWNGKKPTSFWVQAMGPARGGGHTIPTLEQERYMTYAIIAKGATGIFWYSYDHVIDEPGLWEDVKQVAGELNYLHDALAQGHPTETVSVAADGEVLTRFHKVGNKGYLIAVNNEMYGIGEVTFTSPYYIHTAETLFESVPTKNVYGTTFTDTFDRLGVHVYELTLEEVVGTISGTITNTTGAPIERVNVQAEGYFNKTNSTGGYTITNISVGNYIVTVSKTGYQSQSQGNVVVLENQTTTVDFQLTEASDLVGLWHFDEGSETTAADSSVNNNHGTLTNMDPATDWVDGKIGKALEFDNVDDYVDCGNDPSLNITDKITIMGWIKPNAAGEGGPSAGVISTKAQSGVDWSWQLRYNAPDGGNYMGFQFNGDPEGSTWVSVKQNLSPGEWYHIAGTFDGTNIKCYLNGVEKDTNKISAIKNSSSTLFIGQDGWNSIFNGTIDEVRIYNRALSADEIKADYEAGVTGTISGTATDTTDASISGATVTANGYSDPDGTDINGYYIISDVPVGTSYTVTVSKTGYHSQSRKNVEVLEDQTTEVNFTLTEGTDLVAEWHFDEGSGIIAEDTSGNNNNGTLTYMDPATDWVDGKPGKALDFDGSNDYVDCGNVPNFERTDPFSIMAWIKTTDTVGNIAGNSDSSSPYRGYSLLIEESQLGVHLINDYVAGNRIQVDETASGTVNDGNWHFVGMTYTGSNSAAGIKLYIDGQEIGTTTVADNLSATIISSVSLTIGRKPDGNHEYPLDGTIDEVRIYNRALNEEEIKADYEAGLEDITLPETTITSGPDGTINNSVINFRWTGSDDVTPTSQLLYSYKLEGYGDSWSSWTPVTTKSFNGLANYDYTLKVKAKDEAGNEDPTPAERSFTVDIPVTIPRYDVNADGKVDDLDITIVALHYGETTHPPYPRYDVNENSTVDALDITIVAEHFGEITN